MLDIKDTVNEWMAQDDQLALATVVQTWGSSPRKAGSRMVIDAAGRMAGSVSGGCVEAAVVAEALDMLADGAPRLLEFGVSDESAWGVGLSCGGKITIFVEPLNQHWWAALVKRAQQPPVASLTILSGPAVGAKLIVTAGDDPILSGDLERAQLEALTDCARAALEQGQTRRTAVAGIDVLVECLLPSPRLIIVGGAHAAVALHQFADALGFRTILVDPRQAFATWQRFPRAEEIFHEYPQDVFPRLKLDEQTYVAVLTHDPKIDDPALHHALPSPAPYVGVLSSRKTHEKRVARLKADGLREDLISRIHTPIGLNIGARTPEEIALAILAEIVSVRNQDFKKPKREAVLT